MNTPPFHTPLDADQQRAFGMPDPWPLAIADKVRFSELDPLNHVNNVAYLIWFETLRVLYFQHWGLTTYASPKTEPRIVIRHAEMDWLQEMRANEVYVTTCRAIAHRSSSFTLEQEIWAGGTKRARLQSVIVLLSPDGSERHAIPNDLITRFKEVDGVS